jgi:hypothetical protein
MKPLSHRILSALALTTLLSLSAGTAIAQTGVPSAPNNMPQNNSGRIVRLPRSVANAVRQALAQQLNRSPQALNITQASRTVWPDGCLGIVNPAALCSQGQVNGWQVEVTSTNQAETWVYRTDFNGRRLALDPITAERAALQQAAADRAGTRLQVVSTTQQTWSNGCLDLPRRGISCRQLPVTGFRITLAGGNSQLVYHTDATGNSVFLNEQASRITAAVPTAPAIGQGNPGSGRHSGDKHRRHGANNSGQSYEPTYQPTQTAEAFPADVIFRSVTSGGIMGRQSRIDLMTDGRLLSYPSPTQAPTVIRRLDRSEIQAFARQLQAHRFSQMQGRSFAPPTGAADFFGYGFSDAQGTVDFADGSQIPGDLRAIAALWQQLLTR